MHHFLWIPLICTTILVPIAGALPAPQTDHTKARCQSTNAGHKKGIIALSRTYKKYGWAIPQGVTDALAEPDCVITEQKVSTSSVKEASSTPAGDRGTGAGEVSATPVDGNSEYLSPVSVGGQILQVNIDTGSSDLWLFSTLLTDDERGSHTIYDPSKSATHQSISGASFSVSYGDNTSLTGEVATDTVIIGGVTVAHQTIELPTSFSSGVIDDLADGIVGLAFQKINSICSTGGTSQADVPHSCPAGYVPDPRPTWFENAKSALQAGLFTVNMKQGTAASFDFGSIDQTAFEGNLTYIKVNPSEGFWQFPSTRYKIGDGAVQTYSGRDGIADSGSSLLSLDPDLVTAYYAEVQGAKLEDIGYTFPCSADLPNLTVAMGNYMGTILADVINYARTRNGRCYGGIQSNHGRGLQVFGHIMFKSLFVVFDHDHKQLGFAPHA